MRRTSWARARPVRGCASMSAALPLRPRRRAPIIDYMHPTPDQIRAIRSASGLTQAASAALIYAADRTWRQWEAGDAAMPRASAELWCLALVRSGHLTGGPMVQAWVRPELLECVQPCAD